MVDEAMNLFGQMHCRNIIPNVVTYSSLVDGLSKSGRISYALKLVDEMHVRGQPPNIITYNSLFDALCKNHLVEEIALLRKVKDQGIQPNLCTYNILIKGLWQSGRLKDEGFQNLLIKGYNLDVYTYTVMIQGLCDKGLLDEVLALLSKMKDGFCVPNVVTYNIIVCSLFNKGENEKTEKLLREMTARGLLEDGN
ncbi:pentatricopeptide repeat-containing protein At1g62670, mitochondrial-like [Vicia villosa]|uniref:pentatricopeptide repeat-containing protein At1g62670, mitochondrial-like n=1 Tax=Vicia villosa TaxID=3911 RepID=UPI00273AC8A5|nr:pentatricopeptide repeat-containing protein At1g62670, mitochondrial-like [Vicia villosa]